MTQQAATSLVCPACGAAAYPGDRFCEACGADLQAPVDHVREEAAPATVPAGTCPACGADTATAVDGYCGTCGFRLPSARDHQVVDSVTVAAVSDRGRHHPRNEDAFTLHVGPQVAAVVCDGVSSTVNPDMASQAAADAAIAALAAVGSGSDAPLRLVQAFDAARAAVDQVPGEPEPPSLGWPSCTFLACIADRDTIELATMGDCRSYWLPDRGDPEVLTVDDSWAQEQIAASALTPDEAYADPNSHTITRWIGRDADPGWRPRLVQFTPACAGRLVLCSDGLWNYTPTAFVLHQVAGTGSPIETAERLVDFANDQGGHDNVTVIVVSIPKGETQ